MTARISRARRAELRRAAQELRRQSQRDGWPVERIAAMIRVELPDILPLEAWRLAYGWSRPQAVAGISSLYQADGLASPPVSPSMLCRWEHGTHPPGPEYENALCRLSTLAPDSSAWYRVACRGGQEARLRGTVTGKTPPPLGTGTR